ncbi:hypothetical protein D3C71_2043320 [compost metagenome]
MRNLQESQTDTQLSKSFLMSSLDRRLAVILPIGNLIKSHLIHPTKLNHALFLISQGFHGALNETAGLAVLFVVLYIIQCFPK